ncbi:hypothetical protein A5637_10435 [Mycolicibacterium fortuitum]|nr:hypothetical protein A5637_10435 [Mycolicibacterium fortuitum]
MKRWLLTHRHIVLQDELRSRIVNTPWPLPAIRALEDENVEVHQGAKHLTADVIALTATIRHLERIIYVLALENHELRLNRTQSDKIVPLRPLGRDRPT